MLLTCGHALLSYLLMLYHPCHCIVSTPAGSVPTCSSCTARMAQVLALPAQMFLSDSRAMPSLSSSASHAPQACEKGGCQDCPSNLLRRQHAQRRDT